MYFKKNHECQECKIPFNFVWNCKTTVDEKIWNLFCYNCIRHFKNIYRWRFKTQLQNIKRFIWCRLHPTKLEFPLYEVRTII